VLICVVIISSHSESKSTSTSANLYIIYDAAMLADVGATAVLAPAPLAVMVADSVLVSPQSLHWPLWRLCWQMLAPPQSMHLLLMRLCSQMLVPPQNLHWFLWRLCSIFLRPLRGCGALIRWSRWKGPQVHWAQQRTGVRRTDSLRTGQARARSSSASLPGAGAADAGMSF
jgi:hypothetical protein